MSYSTFSRITLQFICSVLCVCLWVAQLCLTLCDLRYCTLPRNSLNKNTGVDSHSLLQGIMSTQGLNLGLPHCRKIILWSESQGKLLYRFSQFSSVAQSCPSLCDPMNRSTPGLPVHHQLLEFTQTHVHWIGDAVQPSHPLSSPSPPAPSPSQHQGLFQWVSCSQEVAKVLEFQLQHQSFQ